MLSLRVALVWGLETGCIETMRGEKVRKCVEGAKRVLMATEMRATLALSAASVGQRQAGWKPFPPEGSRWLWLSRLAPALSPAWI